MLCSRVESDDSGVEVGNFALADREIPIKDVQKLTLNPSDITLSEDASSDRPVDVLEGGIVRELDQEIRIRSAVGWSETRIPLKRA